MNRNRKKGSGAVNSKPVIRMTVKCDACYECKSDAGVTVAESGGLLLGYWEAVCNPCRITVFGKSRVDAMREWNECQRILNSKMIN